MSEAGDRFTAVGPEELGDPVGDRAEQRYDHRAQSTPRPREALDRSDRLGSPAPLHGGGFPGWRRRCLDPSGSIAAWRIIDELRAAGDLRQGPEIIEALIGLSFEHEWQRAEQIAKIIGELGRDVTARIAEALRGRDRRAMALMQHDSDEWWRRRGKIEPFIQTPKQRERATHLERSDEDDASGETK